MNWNNDKVIVYPMGLSGQYSLSIDHSRISHFEILHDNKYRLMKERNLVMIHLRIMNLQMLFNVMIML